MDLEYNSISGVGVIVNEPEVKHKGDKDFTVIRIAQNNYSKDNKKFTMYFSLFYNGKLPEFLNKLIHKGCRISYDGTLIMSIYQKTIDGKPVNMESFSIKCTRLSPHYSKQTNQEVETKPKVNIPGRGFDDAFGMEV